MTDYFYQAGSRRRRAEDEDRQDLVDPRASAYPPEDEAYWAEARVDGSEADWPEDEAGWPDEPAEADWEDPAEAPLDDGNEGGRRAYVAGGQAAAARAAAAAGKTNIRFDPTKERGAVYYDSAARHTRRVTVLKIALPTIAVLSVAAFFLIMSLGEKGDGLPALTLSGIDLDTREITMDKPHISGFDGTKRAYEVTAAKAIQALGNPKVVNLEEIDARFAVSEGVRAHLVSKAGIYDADTQKLQLSGGVTITTDNGYTGELEDADVNIEQGAVRSDRPVKLHGEQGQITADSIDATDHGRHIFFRGNVKVRFQPPDEDGTEDKTPPGGVAATPTNPEPAPAASTEITDTSPNGPS